MSASRTAIRSARRGVLTLALAAIPLTVDAETPPTSRVTGYQYVSPLPGSRLVSRWNNIAIRDGSAIDPATLDAASISVVGSKSGRHGGKLLLSDDARTLVFEPRQPFALGESVVVTLGAGPKVTGGRRLAPLTFGFSVAGRDPKGAPTPEEDWAPLAPAKSGPSVSDLPSGYPTIRMLTRSSPDSGYVFLTPRIIGNTAGLLIIDNNAMPIYYRHASYHLQDFKLQPNGLLTYYDTARLQYYAMNAGYAVVDSFAPGNGYVQDWHDLQLLPNGHCLLLADETQPVAMDTVVEGGDPDAEVMGFVVQELDADKHVVFQWRTFDHFKITDAVHIDLTASWIDYAHMNSVELDADGNLLVSCRHLSEITKIDRQTGDIIWRLGRNAVNNDFAFDNDSRGFSYQHDARRLPNGHITLYDNGNFLDPQTSRAVEYQLDEQEKVVSLVWEARPAVAGWGSSGGSVQRRPNGSTMICWGAGPITPSVTDLHVDGSVAFEFLLLPNGTTTYRAFRWPWRTTRFLTDVRRLDFGPVHPWDLGLLPLTITNNTDSDLTITSFVFYNPVSFGVQEPAPITIAPGESVSVHVQFQPHSLGDMQSTLYVRSDNDSEVVAQDVELVGTGAPNGDLAVRVLSPSGGEAFVLGSTREITWTAADSVGSTKIELLVSRTGSDGPFVPIASGLPNTGRYSWFVTGAVSNHAYVKVIATDQGWDQGEAQSDSAFRIGSPTTGIGDAPIAAFALTGVMPNPASNGARVEFTVARGAVVRLSVVDVLGRTIAVLVDGMHAAGRFRSTWDGRAGGRPAPAGIYLVRLDTPEGSFTRRLALLR